MLSFLSIVALNWVGGLAGQEKVAGVEQQAPILARMKANDEAFDRVALEFLRRTERENRPDSRMPIGLTADEIKGLRPAPFEKVSLFCTREILSVWGSDISFLKRADLDAKEGKQKPELFQKWGNVGGQVQEMFDIPNPDSPQSGRFIERRASPATLARIEEQRMEIEMALGVGYFRRLTKAESVAQNTDGTWTIKGKFRLWVDDAGEGVLTVADDGVVRRADIRSVSRGSHFSVTTCTEGYGQTSLLKIAQAGTYQCVGVSRSHHGKTIPINEPRANHRVTFVDLRKHARRDDFIAAAAIEPPANTFIADMDAKEKRVKKADGTEEVIRKIPPLAGSVRQTSSMIFLIVCLHALLFAGGAGWYLWRRRQRRPAVAG